MRACQPRSGRAGPCLSGAKSDDDECMKKTDPRGGHVDATRRVRRRSRHLPSETRPGQGRGGGGNLEQSRRPMLSTVHHRGSRHAHAHVPCPCVRTAFCNHPHGINSRNTSEQQWEQFRAWSRQACRCHACMHDLHTAPGSRERASERDTRLRRDTKARPLGRSPSSWFAAAGPPSGLAGGARAEQMQRKGGGWGSRRRRRRRGGRPGDRRETRAAAANGTGLAAACACAAAHTLRLGEARVCGHAANLECAPQAKAGWLQRHRMGDGGGGGGEARQFVDCLFFLSCLLLVVEAVDGDGARIAVTTTSTTTTISVSPIHPSIHPSIHPAHVSPCRADQGICRMRCRTLHLSCRLQFNQPMLPRNDGTCSWTDRRIPYTHCH